MTLAGTRYQLLQLQLTAVLLVVALPAADAGVDFSGFFATGREIQGTMDAWYTWQEQQGSKHQGVTTCEWPADLDPEAMTFSTRDFGDGCYFDSARGAMGIRCGKQSFCKINLYKGDICSFRCVAAGVSANGIAVESPDCGWTASETETHPCAVLECDAPSSSAVEGAPRYYPGDVLITSEVKLECQYPGVWRLTASHVPGKCCGWGGCFGVDAGSYSCPIEADGCSPVGAYNEDSGIMCFEGVWVPVEIKA